jgi:predicted transcriptional regulator
MLSSKNSAIRQFKDELLSFAELRNAIVHNPKIDGQAIAEPHESTVKKLQIIFEKVSNPKKVIPEFKAEISGATPDKFINGILEQIDKKSFSQFPVFENDQVIELINTNTIARWLSSNLDNEGSILMEAVKVKDLLPHIEFEENYKFISKNTSIYEAYDLFIKHIILKGRNLDVLFITESGKKSEKLLGWITIADIAPLMRD